MRNAVRPVGWTIGAVLVASGLALLGWTGHGLGLVIIGAIVIVSVMLERRYRPATRRRDFDGRWSPTEERFIDPESGAAMEVWIDTLTGERRYLPIDSGPIAGG